MAFSRLFMQYKASKPPFPFVKGLAAFTREPRHRGQWLLVPMSWAARFKLRLHLWCQVVKGVCECHCKPQTDYPETSDKFSGHTKWPHLLDCTFQLGGGWGFWGVFRLLVFLWEGGLHFRVIRLENLFEFFILEGDLHDCYLNFHQLLEQFYAFKPKHLEKCIFQGKKNKSHLAYS